MHPIEAPPLGNTPLSEAKKKIGIRVCLEGNIQVGYLFTETSATIRDLVKRAIDEGAAGGGFILCTCASPYAPKLSPQVVENYLAMIETAVEYGGY